MIFRRILVRFLLTLQQKKRKIERYGLLEVGMSNVTILKYRLWNPTKIKLKWKFKGNGGVLSLLRLL